MIDPQAQAVIKAVSALGNPPLEQQTPSQARQLYAARKSLTGSTPRPVQSVTDISFKGPGGELMLRHYRPQESVPSQALATVLYFHGGGYVVGNLESHDTVCRHLCAQSGCAVVAVDYRLAPEHRFPAAFEDCLAATYYVFQNAASLGVDTTRMAVAGDSAGGQLAASVALTLRNDNAISLAFALLIYPITDPTMSHPSIQSNGAGYMLTQNGLRFYYGHYFEGQAWHDDQRAIPIRAKHFEGLPQTLVLTAGLDPLRDEGYAYANALSAAGVQTQYVCFERQIHGFVTMGGMIDEASLALDLCAGALSRALSDPLGKS
jgi:acetyl esterase